MHARKRFGQHFLIDDTVLQRIVEAIAPQVDDHLVEIGPGKGALTEYLIPLAKKLDLIEIDRDLVALLNKSFEHCDRIIIHSADVLEFDFSTLDDKQHRLRVVGNLPYNISTPLLFKLFGYGNLIQDMYFMLQKEVVERLTATVGASNYGRLSVMSQYYCTSEMLFIVKPTAFKPPPNVYSAVIRIQPRAPTLPANDLKLFGQIVREAFSHRRKTIHNAVKKIVPAELFEKLNINPQLRPQELGVEEFVKISNAMDAD